MDALSVSICEQEFPLSRIHLDCIIYKIGFERNERMWKQGVSWRMKLCLPPCTHTNVVTELRGIYSSVFSTLHVHCFSSSYQNLLRSESFAFFRDFFQLGKASELTRNPNGMLHYVRAACLVCSPRNNQEKLYVKRHRCSFLRNSYILLKYNMKKDSWNLEQYIFCICICILLISFYIGLQNKNILWKMPRNEYIYYVCNIAMLYTICNTRQQMFIMLMLILIPECFFEY